MIDAQVLIVGGGPAGLTAATTLRTLGVKHVVVLEREQHLGGIPRHTDHLGFGVRDRRRVLSGPTYAKRLIADAHRCGVDLRPGVTVVEVAGDGVRLATGEHVAADGVVLATGVRERPRSARLVPGDRPAGVYTTGSIQQLVALHGRGVGHRAVIVGAEHVSFSAIWTLRHGGCTPVAMLTTLPRHQTMAPLRWATATLHRVPIITDVEVAAIVGRRRVESVELSDGRSLQCDTVVFTGDWVPEHELARRAGLVMIPRAKGPATTVDQRTSMPGVFAVGNLAHPAETADVCALDGRAVAAAVVEWIATRSWPAEVPPIAVESPVSWAAYSSHGITTRVDRVVRGRAELTVDGDVVARTRRRLLVPNRAIILDAAAVRASPGAVVGVRIWQ